MRSFERPNRRQFVASCLQSHAIVRELPDVDMYWQVRPTFPNDHAGSRLQICRVTTAPVIVFSPCTMDSRLLIRPHRMLRPRKCTTPSNAVTMRWNVSSSVYQPFRTDRAVYCSSRIEMQVPELSLQKQINIHIWNGVWKVNKCHSKDTKNHYFRNEVKFSPFCSPAIPSNLTIVLIADHPVRYRFFPTTSFCSSPCNCCLVFITSNGLLKNPAQVAAVPARKKSISNDVVDLFPSGSINYFVALIVVRIISFFGGFFYRDNTKIMIETDWQCCYAHWKVNIIKTN